MELMNCQMCSGDAGMNWDKSSYWVECCGCGLSTGGDDLNDMDDEGYYSPLTADSDQGRKWNRMQSLIAKGLLIEEEAAATREVKGRL